MIYWWTVLKIQSSGKNLVDFFVKVIEEK